MQPIDATIQASEPPDEKKEPSGYQSLSPEYKKLWGELVTGHPWVQKSEPSTI